MRMKKQWESVAGIDGLIEAGEALRVLSADVTVAAPRKVAARSDRVFHTRMAIAFLLTAFIGFAPKYYLKSVTHAPALSPLLHVHGVVFSAWLLLLLTQTSLVAARRVDIHRRLGIGGAALALLMVPLGVMAAIDAARRGVSNAGLDPMSFLVFPLGQILMFAAFIGVGLWHRRRPELHRRLVMLATISLMAPAFGRFPYVGKLPVVPMLLSVLFVVAAAIHDKRTRGRVHPIYIAGGLITFLSGPARFALAHTEAWQTFARFLVG
jgi:hypothetical protein